MNCGLWKVKFMNIERVQKSLSWAIIASETSHVFCCVLPTLFSFITLAAGLGLIAVVPAGLTTLHETLHHWEVPVILFSGVFVFLGWVIHYVSEKLDCHDTGCVHGPCGTKKKTAGKILKIATVMFILNIGIYIIFHQGMEVLLN